MFTEGKKRESDREREGKREREREKEGDRLRERERLHKRAIPSLSLLLDVGYF